MSPPKFTAPPETDRAARLWWPPALPLDRRAVAAVLGAFLLTRAMILLIVFVSLIIIPPRSGPGLFLYTQPTNLLVDGLVRWDSWGYANIVEAGYDLGDPVTGRRPTVVFFPLYPLAVQLVAPLVGDVFVAGLLVSHGALLVALGYLYALTRREFDEDAAGRAVFYLAAAPTAVFFSAMYTESLFLALATATLYHARQGHWHRAALVGALAAATRNTGVLLAAAIGLEALAQSGVRLWPAHWRSANLGGRLWGQVRAGLGSWRGVVAAACVPVGLLGYMSYLANSFGDPLAFITAQAAFGRTVSSERAANVITYSIRRLNLGERVLAGQVNAITLLDIILTLIFLGLIVAVALKMRPSYAAFAALTFAVPLLSGTVSSMTRYVLMLVPCFMILGHWGRRPWVDRLVLGFSLPLMAYFAILFSHWYFAG